MKRERKKRNSAVSIDLQPSFTTTYQCVACLDGSKNYVIKIKDIFNVIAK